MNELLELYLYTEVLGNTVPKFSSDLKTVHMINVSIPYEYTLPEITDSENNDEFEVYIDYDNDPDNLFPPFMTYDNST